ncbi:peptidoglycan DD-metalloendopeptidase family protein [Paraneptunicella aestuarii]|uniref:peptidoglycan DD-metalloendopeptidase family protein n=1 Tax=Paraneptunicella aestuarii TaxID=2831148 RepID=UPI001E296FC7|nr:peptidoglycan DD-metalloendopeptidase family protein [Paraneptunicella aestuarii]UAA39366.1 peptidoglycan DD-metalloendopeptidase family protein [Paraneptunicella aestuarii]
MVQKQLIHTIKALPRQHKLIMSGLMFMLLILAVLPSEKASASRNTPVVELELGKRYSIDVAPVESAIEEQIADDTKQEWKSYKVKSGDNLAKIFARAGLSPQDVYKVSKAGKEAKKLLTILPGEEIQILLDEQDNAFKGLRYAFSSTDTLLIEQNKGTLSSQIEHKAMSSRLNFSTGDIENSFWNAGVKSGLTDNQIMSLANIFGWDIDFALDIREGDSFNVIFEENFIEGEFIGYGDIVAAEFTNQGETYTAIRYKDGNYYTPEGRSMRKSFLRAPVNFKYISSNFKPRRFHPVQKRWKQHRGIDYAASTGTPVVAAGDGKVIKAGYDKYNGHHVFIQHGENYVTKYLHFSKRKVKKGQWVKQGQTIGLVGSTGLASGPHLHYEFLVNGVHQNPRTVTLPKANPIANKEKTEFLALASDYMDKLQNNKRIMLAMN